ncbi:DUF5700 domain-containing putative Zn-dependent protease [Pseudoalteromonas byunsanensis]|uniref:DUF5700 domain-containing putative Zn-dependent protease n=1 Tax=Pseudoalteromonas byunsanensis TaxID=327939 RepID=UPI001113C8E3|nr:DUF5700 domain-containing putative Zn-dependent protease [Pseudoalteromonas byunsanensis]
MSSSNKASITDIESEGAEIFWEVQHILLQNDLPTEKQWQALFQTPGYFELVANEIPEQIFKQLFILAFKPSEYQKAEKLINDGNIKARFIQHLRSTQHQQQALSAFIKVFTNSYSKNYKEYVRLAQEYLPNTSTLFATLPKISFSYFDNDARGFKKRIVLDPLFALSNESSLKYWIAHEFHHYFSHDLAAFRQPEENTPDADVMWILIQTQLEGIADLVDKSQIYFQKGYMEDSLFAQIYKEKYQQSTTLLAGFDELFQQYSDMTYSQKAKQELAVQIRKSLPMAGHPTGYFMARAIEQYQGKQALVSSIGNPFMFFTLYQSAAIEHNTLYQFSQQTMRNIELLEKKYAH